MNQKIDLTYQRVAVHSASPIGLTILLYDRLVADVQSAISAMRQGDIEKRCAEIHHAHLILQQLEFDLNMDEGGETARCLATFYSHTRAMLLEAQIKNSPQVLQDQIELVLQVRSAWYQVDSQTTSAMTLPSDPKAAVATPQSRYDVEERVSANWSA